MATNSSRPFSCISVASITLHHTTREERPSKVEWRYRCVWNRPRLGYQIQERDCRPSTLVAP
jgi:hypothetical protein